MQLLLIWILIILFEFSNQLNVNELKNDLYGRL